VAQKRNILGRDRIIGKNPGQKNIESRNRVMDHAGRRPENNRFPQEGEGEHGARQHRGSIKDNFCPGPADSCKGHIIGVHR
jgi:hypothetical protein